MTTAHALSKTPLALASALTLALGLMTAPAHAQIYKIVNPDGTVTFTDHPPAVGKGSQKALKVSGASSGTSTASFPPELRKAVGTYPVTLYSAESCKGCDQIRSLLTKRGVPFSERTVSTKGDYDEIQKISGARSVPVLKIGSKVMSGTTDNSINKYLTAAGYPAESVLPDGYKPAPVKPLTEKAPTPAPEEAPQPEAEVNQAPQAPGGFRF